MIFRYQKGSQIGKMPSFYKVLNSGDISEELKVVLDSW